MNSTCAQMANERYADASHVVASAEGSRSTSQVSVAEMSDRFRGASDGRSECCVGLEARSVSSRFSFTTTTDCGSGRELIEQYPVPVRHTIAVNAFSGFWNLGANF